MTKDLVFDFTVVLRLSKHVWWISAPFGYLPTVAAQDRLRQAQGYGVFLIANF